MKLPEYIKKIKELDEASKVDTNAAPANIRIGAETRRQMAIRELEITTLEFHRAVEQNLVGILLQGDPKGVEAFVAIAEDEAAAIAVQADEMYANIAKVTMEGSPRGGTEIGINQVSNFLSAVHGTANSIGIRLPLIQFNHAIGQVGDLAFVTGLVKETIRNVVGNDLNVLYLRRKVSQKVMDLDVDAIQTKVPVVLVGTPDANLAGLLFGDSNLVVDVKDVVEKSQVIRAFKQLKDTIKKKEK